MKFPAELLREDFADECAARLAAENTFRFPPNRKIKVLDKFLPVRSLNPPYLYPHPTIPKHKWDPRIQADVDAMLLDDKHKKRLGKSRSPLYTPPSHAALKRQHAKKRGDGAFRFLGPNK